MTTNGGAAAVVSAAAPPRPPEASEVPSSNRVVTNRGGDTAGESTSVPPGRLVSHHVVGGNLNALAKIATLFNVLWRTSTCACCKEWTVDDYKSAGSFHPAVSVKRRRQRDQRLQETAAGC